MSTMWGENPTLLACGHLAEPMAGFGWRRGVKTRECHRCGDWQPVLLVAPDIDLTGAAADEPGETPA